MRKGQTKDQTIKVNFEALDADIDASNYTQTEISKIIGHSGSGWFAGRRGLGTMIDEDIKRIAMLLGKPEVEYIVMDAPVQATEQPERTGGGHGSDRVYGHAAEHRKCVV